MQTFKRLPNPVVLTAILAVALAATLLFAATHDDVFPRPSENIGTLDTGGLAGQRPSDPPTHSASDDGRATRGSHAREDSAGVALESAPTPAADEIQRPLSPTPVSRTRARPSSIGPQQTITGPSTASKPPRAASSPKAHAARALTAGPRPLVVSIDGGYASWSDSETEQRAALGAAVTRHEWNPEEPVDEQDDVVLSAAGEIHTRIHALLGGNQLGDAAHYRDWTISFIRRYGLGGSFWVEHPELDESRYAITSVELGNEPYLGEMSADLYADTVRPTLEEIHRLQLPVGVVLPSRVYGKNTSWIDTLYQQIPDLNSLFYAFAEHPYWYGHDPAEVNPGGPFARIDTLRRRMDELDAATKPIFITEYGESTAVCGSECVNETVQAEHLSKMLDAAIARTEWRVEMISVFQLLDRGTDSTDRELQFGLLRQNGTQKPSYSIIRTAIQQYRG